MQNAHKNGVAGSKKRLIIFVTIALAVIVLAVWGFYCGLVVRVYKITSDKVPEGTSVRIVVIADLHSRLYGKEQQSLLDMIKAQQPDMIALVGDIVDDNVPQTGAKLFLRDIADIAPTYYVSGNHEYWSGKYDDIRRMIEAYGITVLSNESRYLTVKGACLCLCGIDDPEVFEYTEDKQLLALKDISGLLERFLGLNDDTFNILLAHRSENIEYYAKYGFDLALSGHAHGGQIRIPLFINGIFAPDQGYFPKYGGGQYKLNDLTMVVSRGLGFDERVPRVFNPPEVVVVDIKGE